MLHPLVRWISRRALRWFYRDLTIVGAERIPADGPVLLVGNHPNDLPDVLIGYLATARPVRYVATSAAANSAMVRWAYHGLSVIPVTRVRDARKMKARGVDMAAANRVAFQRVTDALAVGDMVGVFPEGGVYAGPGIGPIRSGVARLALESTLAGTISGVVVVAIGVQYEAPDRPGSDVLAVIGEPMALDGWLQTAGEHPHVAFTGALRRMLEAVSRTAITASEAGERDRTIATVGASIARAGESPMAAAHRALATWHRLAQDPAANSAITLLGDATRRAGGQANSAADCRRVIDATLGARPARALGPIALAALAPLAVLGLAVHAPMFAASRLVSRRVSDATSDRAARTIVPGLYLMFVWYAVLALLLALALRAGTPAEWPLVLAAVTGFALLLPRLGDLAVAWRRALRAVRLERRVRRLSEAERAAVRTSAGRLHALHEAHAAQVSHLHGSAVSVLA
jgi:1-acyl-sn-glycerol-3-phosphate acyltransferase